ncbi:MAG: VWA domain-containing protein [Actinobacteria bacterium]|nr:VWA domain-containing protein [Actinomycetota bacterium]
MLVKRFLAGLASTAVVAGLTTTAVTVAATTATAAVPPPSATSSVVTVKVGGSRTGVSDVTGLQGVVLELWTNVNGAPGQKVNEPWAECTSDADGDCNFTVPDTEVDGDNYRDRFWIKRVSSPAGWFGLNALVTGSPFQLTDYQFRTPRLTAGQTYSSQDDFMIGTGDDNRQASGGIWQTSLNNPAFPPKCGIKVALVLDVSGSVGSSLNNLKTAAKTFVNSLVGTPSQVGLFTFATNAPANNTNNQNRPLTPVSTQAGADTVNTWIGTGNNGSPGATGLTSGGATNWDRGMYQVAQSASAYDVAVVITDGNPTVYGSPDQGPGNFTRFREVENGIFSANAIKAENTRVIAFGVGDGVSGNSANLQSISGQTANSDYFQTDNYQQAGDALKALASANCEGTVNVIKQVLPPGGQGTDGATPAGGWTFGATSAAPLTVDPASGQTADGTGALSFNVDFNGATSGNVTVTETQQAGYSLYQVGGFNAVCKRLSDNSSVSVTNTGPTGFTVDAPAGDGISCTVYNRAENPPAEVVVDKEWVINGAAAVPDGQQPDGLSAALTVAGNGQPWGVPATGFETGDKVVLNETVTNDLPLCEIVSQKIRKGDGQQSTLSPDGFEATLDAGSNAYTMTNAVDCDSRLTLTKAVEGGNADPLGWILNASNGLNGFDGSSGVSSFVEPGVTYALSESSGDPRYVQFADPNAVPIPNSTISWDCEAAGNAGFADGLNGGVTVPLGFDVTCEATNETATLTLLKEVVNNQGGTKVPADWTLTATPQGNVPAGLDPVSVTGADTATQSNTFNVRPGQAYGLTESAVDGYTMDSLECSVNGEDAVPATSITLEPLDTAVCTFTNNDQPGKLTLEKIVQTGPDAKSAWTLTATPSNIPGQGVVQGNGDPTSQGGVKDVTVFAGTYDLSELGPDWYSQVGTWQCTGGTMNQAQTAVTVPSGGNVSCQVTNARQTGELLLQKIVEGGSSTPADWTLTADAKAPLDDKNYSESGANTDPKEVWAGTTYTLAETGPGDYSPLDWNCEVERGDVVGPQASEPINDGNLVQVPPGATVICTIVNVRDTAELKLVKQVEGADPNSWTLTAKADAPDDDKNISTPGGSGQFEEVYAGTQYTLAETGPGGYSASDWVCLPSEEEPVPTATEGQLNDGDTITLKAGQRVVCTIVNTRDLGSLTITKEFNAQQSGFTGTFDITYTCVDGADKVKEGTVKLAAGASETITGLPTGTVCTVDEPILPTPPSGWQFNAPTYSPSNTATVTTKDQTVSVTVVNSIAQVNPVVVKKICPIDVTLKKPQPKKVGNKILTKKIKTNSSCVLVKPVVLCRPLASSAAGETAFCDTKVTKKGRITVKTKGYDAVKVTVIVRAKPKPGFTDRWKPNTWRKSWILK